MQNDEQRAERGAVQGSSGICIFDLARELSGEPQPSEIRRIVVSDWAYAFAPSPLGRVGRSRSLLGFLRLRRLRAVRFLRPILPATARYLDANGVVHEITVR